MEVICIRSWQDKFQVGNVYQVEREGILFVRIICDYDYYISFHDPHHYHHK